MDSIIQNTAPVLLIGNSDLLAGVALCLNNAGHQVYVCTDVPGQFHELYNQHIDYQKQYSGKALPAAQPAVDTRMNSKIDFKLIIAVTSEDLKTKQKLLKKIEPVAKADTIVAINTESFAIGDLAKDYNHPENLIGLNWTEPAHTTFFLEIISGEKSREATEKINDIAKTHWGKDPYIVANNGIRGRLISAMAREASFLVDNDYATVDDIDRACRNDAGYYLPFCGNCRYMDLMGTYAYGMVMKDLNPDLSKDQELPGFIKQVVDAGGKGMKNAQGFYEYNNGDVQKWRDTMAVFTYQIQEIIEKYPFNYNKKPFTD